MADHGSSNSESHRDLVDGPYNAALTTIMPTASPDDPGLVQPRGEYVLINTMQEFRKAKNMRLNPKVTLLAFDPKNPFHHIEIRGTVVVITRMARWNILTSSRNST